MNITQQDIQKARPSKAGRWPEEPALQPLHRKQRPRKGQGSPKAPEQVQTGPGPPESQAEPTPLAAPPVQYWFHNDSASGSDHAAGSCSGSSIWIYLVLQRGQERERARSDPTSLPREGACVHTMPPSSHQDVTMASSLVSLPPLEPPFSKEPLSAPSYRPIAQTTPNSPSGPGPHPPPLPYHSFPGPSYPKPSPFALAQNSPRIMGIDYSANQSYP
ncbi:hypothetical protein MJT46_001537 [Ovis ammon polii x Ovis aries]|nr:hypothetical protein MJT46_001537 [Ovis ammon polii x Ovis aries]